MWVSLLVFSVVALGIFRAFFLRRNYGHWKKLRVPNPPVSPFFGNIGEAIFLKKSLGQVYDGIYRAYPSYSYVGLYKLNKPGILVRDPELIKEVLIKNFNSFHDNDIEVEEKVNNPFVLRGERWKTVKNQISPAFTNKRIKPMFSLMEEVCKKLIQHLEETQTKNCFEAKDLANKYSINVAAHCAFGVEVNSFEDSNGEFRKMAQKLVASTYFTAIKLLIHSLFPPLANYFKIEEFQDDVAKYFGAIVSQTLEYRKNNNVHRSDFLGHLCEFNSKLGEDIFTIDDIIDHTIGILFDGSIGAIVLSFALYELGANHDVQNKLKEEIDQIIENNGKFSYNNIQEMSYLDKVLNECLRKNTTVSFFAKLCTEEFKFPNPEGNGPDVTIEPGTFIVIPVSSIHNDPKYYPNPDKFDPERFSEENKQNRPKCTFLPFGDGPRVCIGMRYGVMQVKLAIVHLVLNFEIRINKKTISPIKIDPKCFFHTPKSGIWLDFHKRLIVDTEN